MPRKPASKAAPASSTTAKRKAAPKKKATPAKTAAKPGKVVVVLRPGWHHDPYRRAGGLVIPSDTPTEVDADLAEYLITTFGDAFTVQK